MNKRQQGITTAEAAIGAVLMFVILFGIIEISRLVFVWNTLDTTTRRAARVAAVCPFGQEAIKSVAIFSIPGETTSPLVRGLDTSDIEIEYFDAAGLDPWAHPTLTPIEATRFVHARIEGYQIPLLMFNRVTLTAPPFGATLPSESLGFNPTTGTCGCFTDDLPCNPDTAPPP